MNDINEAITRFLQQQTLATICCADEYGIPWCFTCFYVFNRENGLLYFKSSADAHHSMILAHNPVIAGAILPDKLNKLVKRGIQLQGEVLEHLHPLSVNASALYHKKIPMALAIKGEVYTVRLTNIKMTDSNLGFGKKIIWERSDNRLIAGAK